MNVCRGRKLVFLFAIACPLAALFAGPLAAEEVVLPTADALIGQMIDAAGGKAAMDKIKSRSMTMTGTIPSMNLTMRMNTLQVEGKFVNETDMGQMGGKMVEATNGEHGWLITPQTGPTLLEGAPLDDLKRGAHVNELLVLDRLYKEKKVSGVEHIDKVPCYKLELVSANDGSLTTWFVDTATSLQKRILSTHDTPMGKVPLTLDLTDYRAVDGIQIPHKITHTQAGMSIGLTVDKCEHNLEIPPDRFAPPPVIQALIDKKKAGGGDGAKPAEGGQPPPPPGGEDKPTTKPKG